MKMKILLLFILLFADISGYAQRKIALIIANSRYDVRKYGWRVINSKNDVGILSNFFKNQQFDTVFIRQDLNKADMIRSLEDFRDFMRKGDIAHIHVSSHGQQVFDMNGDELDGLDEALIPLDCPASAKYQNTTEHHITDDELDPLILSMRQTLASSGTLVFSVDACHSGSVNRGEGIVRGGEPPFVPTGKSITPKKQEHGNDDFLIKQEQPGNGNLSAFILMAASQPEQLAGEHRSEGVWYGSLSYAIASSSSSIGPESSYRGWFANVMGIMGRMTDIANRPQLEGDIDKQVYGGKAIRQTPYYTISRIINGNSQSSASYENSGSIIIINAGIIAGLTQGSMVWVMPSGAITPDEARIVTRGKILNTSLYETEIRLEKELVIKGEKQLSEYWVFLMDKKVPVIKAKVYAENKSLTGTLNSKIVEWSDKKSANFRIEPVTPGTLRILNNKTGIILIPELKKERFNEDINRLARAEFLNSLNVVDNEALLNIRLVPVKINLEKQFVDTLPLPVNSSARLPHFTDKDRMVLEIHNPTKSKLYFNILDIQPDGILNLILPRETMISENCYIDPGKTRLLKDLIISFSPPFGEERFKLFVSKAPVDLTNIVASRGSGGYSGMQAIERIFSVSFQSETRGPIVEYVPAGSGSIIDYIFNVRKGVQ